MKSGLKIVSIVLLFVALVLVNYLASAGRARLDLTADKIYTLSDGTRAMLRKIEEPVTLQFYYSRSIENLPLLFKNYASRVEEMLRQYVAAADGKVKLVVIDPKPDSKEEETATRSGLRGQALGNGRSLFLGLVVQQADQEKSIPLFSPNREPFIEYDVSRLIDSIQKLNKPKLGLLTTLPLRGSQFAMPGMPPQREQVVVEEWGRSFEVVDVTPGAGELPAGLDALAIIQPQNLSEKMLFAIDQFVLSGKPVFIAVDPSSRLMRSQAGRNAMMGGPPPNASSDLPGLFAAWGVAYNPQNVVGDLDLAATFQTEAGLTRFPTIISLRAANLDRGFEPANAIRNLWVVDAGSLAFTATPELTATPILQSSLRAGPLSSFMLQMGAEVDLSREVKPTGRNEAFALLLQGTFKTAFPNGAPKEPPPPAPDAARPDAPPAAAPAAPALTVSAKPGHVFVVADTDWLVDAFSVRRSQFMGLDTIQPLNDNLAFAANVVEFLGGSSDLISLRAKGTSVRPFDVIRKMQIEATDRYQAQLQAVETRLQDIQKNLSKLLQGQKDQLEIVATPEIQAEIDKIRAEEAQARAERREIRASLRANIEFLQNILIALNVLVMPALVTVGGLWFFHVRHQRQRSARS